MLEMMSFDRGVFEDRWCGAVELGLRVGISRMVNRSTFSLGKQS